MHSHTTIFLVSNLHCPSCVGNIEAALASRTPSASLVSNSIVNQTVTIRHQESAKGITELLEELGYEVDSTAAQTDSNQGRFVQHVRRSRQDLDPQLRLDRANRHRQNCKQCQKEAEKQGTDTPVEKAPESSDFVVTDASDSHGLYEVSLSVEGMTCASCVGTISKALEKTPWVASNKVNLLSASATVRIHGDNHIDELVEIIEDAGYDVKVQETRRLKTRRSPTMTTVLKNTPRKRSRFGLSRSTLMACIATTAPPTSSAQSKIWIGQSWKSCSIRQWRILSSQSHTVRMDPISPCVRSSPPSPKSIQNSKPPSHTLPLSNRGRDRCISESNVGCCCVS